jgi:HEAT repeat protein
VLGRLGGDDAVGVAALRARLHDEHWQVIKEVVTALGRTGAPAVASELLSLLTSPTADLRKAAAVALGDLGVQGADALLALEALERDPDADVRKTAARVRAVLATAGPAQPARN